jgi:hypothetical protein
MSGMAMLQTEEGNTNSEFSIKIDDLPKDSIGKLNFIFMLYLFITNECVDVTIDYLYYFGIIE